MVDKLKLFSLFSGIGAFEKALTNLHIDYELVGFSEIDKAAITSYCTIHNVNSELNYGNVQDIATNQLESLPEFDLLTCGFPCTNISASGKQEGFEEGSNTSSSLLWDSLKIVKASKPKYIIFENVKNILTKKFKQDSDNWMSFLESEGYTTTYKVLNSVDHGIPQNRERVFFVAIREGEEFHFPGHVSNMVKLDSVLEKEVDAKFYLKNSDYYINQINLSEYDDKPYINGAIRGRYGENKKVVQRLEIQKKGVTNTLTTVQKDNVVVDLHKRKVRNLTPKECFRLMGFTDEDYEKAVNAGTKQSNLYKQAGNSIVVPVIEYIFKGLFKVKLI